MTKFKKISRPQKEISPLNISNRNKYRRKHNLHNYEIIMQSLKTVTKQYCVESSICGLKHLVSNNVSYYERCVNFYI